MNANNNNFMKTIVNQYNFNIIKDIDNIETMNELLYDYANHSGAVELAFYYDENTTDINNCSVIITLFTNKGKLGYTILGNCDCLDSLIPEENKGRDLPMLTYNFYK